MFLFICFVHVLCVYIFCSTATQSITLFETAVEKAYDLFFNFKKILLCCGGFIFSTRFVCVFSHHGGYFDELFG